MTPNLPAGPPPPVLTGLYVAVYAHVDETIVFEQRHTLSVDGVWLDRVPNVAICQDFDSREYLIQYCDANWELLGIAGSHQSVNEAKAKVERSYHGIHANWISSSMTFDAAQALHEAERKEGACSFCGKSPPPGSMVFGQEARICSECVQQFHADLQTDD